MQSVCYYLGFKIAAAKYTSLKITAIVYVTGLRIAALGPKPAREVLYLRQSCWFGRMQHIPKQSQYVRCPALELLCNSFKWSSAEKAARPLLVCVIATANRVIELKLNGEFAVEWTPRTL